MRTLLLLLAVALLPQGQQGIDAPRISQQDFKKLIAAKNVIIVDTRNEDAFPAGHIPGAIKLPLEGQMTWPEEYEKTAQMLVKSTKPVVTYCA
jgi:predicted sulfurtransferase